ncbi:MAG: sugar phosphate isomerase/epimerase [Lachnospiraceae bacterium]|jgi:sugar phosphate isomerase/epimerase|nr:sugar phosphate isomerase/epimerase [Lachnospiraceae bacterium]MCI8959341.1 sugar phosphate isomerase/epimerase [Lachnospiraceae bacterium]
MKFSSTITIQYDTPFSPFPARDCHQALDWLRDSGFDGAEVCISHYRGLDVKDFKKELDLRGLSCSNISTGQARTLEHITLLHEGIALRQAKTRLKEHIDAAKILGCKVTLGLIRGLGTPGHEKEEKATIARNLEEIICYAQEKQVIIILEAINRYETTLFTSAESCMDFIEKDLGNPDCVAVHWDLFHANIEDSRLDEAIDRMGSKLQHVHLADSNRHFPGYGHLDFEAVFRKLKAVGYQEYCSFECFNLPSPEAVKAQAGPFIRKMRQQF